MTQLLEILPSTLTTIPEVESFIELLYSNDKFFHLDDDAKDIIYPDGKQFFTDEEADKLNELKAQAFEICEVWDLPIIEKILDELHHPTK